MKLRKEIIIGFKAVDCPTYNPSIIQMKDALYHSHIEGLTLYQPKLTYFAISSGNKYIFFRFNYRF